MAKTTDHPGVLICLGQSSPVFSIIKFVEEKLAICLDRIDPRILEESKAWISALQNPENIKFDPWAIKLKYL